MASSSSSSGAIQRSVALSVSEPAIYVDGRTQGYQVIITVQEAVGLPEELFVRQRGPNDTDTFSNVASPADLEEYPVAAPETGQFYYRVASITLVYRSIEQLNNDVLALKTDICSLLESLKHMDTLQEELVVIDESCITYAPVTCPTPAVLARIVAAARDPRADDNAEFGYGLGSLWTNTETGQPFILTAESDDGVATWTPFGLDVPSHNQLSGRDVFGAHPPTAIPVYDAYWSGPPTEIFTQDVDTDVQQCFQTVNDMLKTVHTVTADWTMKNLTLTGDLLSAGDGYFTGDLTIDGSVIIGGAVLGHFSDLTVDNDIVVGGLVDGVNVSAHATRHQFGGADPIKLDNLATPDDNTDLDATVTYHGLLPKLSGGTTLYLRGDGTWADPSLSTDQASEIHTDVTAFDHILGAADTDVQLALNTLDDGVVSILGDTMQGALAMGGFAITGAGDIAATSFSIGGNQLTTAEWAFLDGQDQAVAKASSPTFAGLTVSGLTASRLVATGAGSVLASVADLTSWVAGTSNQVTVASDGDGTITLSTPQNIHTGASPTFVGLTLTGNITMPEDGWIGIGAAAERIMFDGTGGALEIMGANLSIGSTSPSTFGDPCILVAALSPRLTLADNSVQAFVTISQESNQALIARDDGDALLFGTRADCTAAFVGQWQIDASGNLLTAGTRRIYFEAGASFATGTESIYSAADGYLDYAAATGHRFAGATSILSPYSGSLGQLTIRSTDNDSSGIIFRPRSAGAQAGARTWAIFGSNAVAGNLDFRYSTTNTNDVSLFAMSITNAGRVGIGITAAKASLHVLTAGTSGVTDAGRGILITDSTYPRLMLENPGDTSGTRVLDFYLNDGAATFRALNDAAGATTVDNIFSMNVASGAIGIGTNAPGIDLNGGSTDLAAPVVHFKGTACNLVIEGSTRAQILLSDTGATSNARMFGIVSESDVMNFYSLNDDLTTRATAFQIEADGDLMFSPSAARKTYWRDTAISISSQADGYLDFAADTGARVTSPALWVMASGPDFVLAGSGASDQVDIFISANSINSSIIRSDHGLNQLLWAVDDGVGLQFVLCHYDWRASDFDHVPQTTPTMYWQDDSSPGVSNNKYGSVTHDGTGLLFSTGAATGVGTVPATIENDIRFAPQGTERFMLTPGGGYAIKLTNKTGGASVKGTVVMAHATVGDAFNVAVTNSVNPIGVVYTDGVADGSECWVVIQGRAQMLLEDSTTLDFGDWLGCSTTPGRIYGSATPPAAPEHDRECGHSLDEELSGGTDVLVWGVLHFR